MLIVISVNKHSISDMFVVIGMLSNLVNLQRICENENIACADGHDYK